MTIRQHVLDIVAQRANQPFLLDAIAHRERTYGQFHQLACSLAAELRRRGVGPGDRVALIFPNCCELAFLYFACMYLGATIVPINPNLSATDARFILSSCNPRLLLCSSSCAGRLTGSPLVPVTVALAQEPLAASVNRSETIVMDALPEASDFAPLPDSHDEDWLAIVYTSGTTARPKGLVHKIGSMFRNATAFAAQQQLDHSCRFYSTLSMAYMGGFYNLLILPFLIGASVIIDHVFDARSSLSFWDRADHHGANTLWLAPTVMSILMKMDRGAHGQEFCRRKVRRAFVGFAPLPLNLKQDFEAKYGVRLIENYGLSETLFLTARCRSELAAPGYVGEALPGIALRILSNSGSPADANAEGEVQVLTPDLMAGYLDETGSLQRVSASEWFSTGDYGRLDSHGSLSITGRKKDIIIRGGINISPVAVEEVLLRCRGVVDAAVVSIPHELYGEDIVAVVKLEPGIELESVLDAITAEAKQNLALHQQPARYVSIEEFPRTANGKVQKVRLRELVLEKLQMGSKSAFSLSSATAEAAKG
jgi:long-chain acyl-CoA synthetase